MQSRERIAERYFRPSPWHSLPCTQNHDGDGDDDDDVEDDVEDEDEREDYNKDGADKGNNHNTAHDGRIGNDVYDNSEHADADDD